MGVTSPDAPAPRLFGPGCSNSGADRPYACPVDPQVAGTLTSNPTSEHYRVNDMVLLGVYFDDRGEYFGGYLRDLYAEGDARNDRPFIQGCGIVGLRDEGDGTYVVEGKKGVTGCFNTTGFRRTAVGASQTGTFTDRNGAGPFAYTAVRVD